MKYIVYDENNHVIAHSLGRLGALSCAANWSSRTKNIVVVAPQGDIVNDKTVPGVPRDLYKNGILIPNLED